MYNRVVNSAQEKRCAKVMRGHGIQVTNRHTPANSFPECDLVWAFEAAAKNAGRLLNTNNFLSGLRDVGTSWQSVCFSYKGGTLAAIA